MSDEHFQILRDSFPLDTFNFSEFSWEDVTIANMANLFKHYFSGDSCKDIYI